MAARQSYIASVAWFLRRLRYSVIRVKLYYVIQVNVWFRYNSAITTL